MSNQFIEKISKYTQGSNPRRPLGVEETAQGLTAFYINAAQLVEDSWCLADHGRLSRAISLLVLAIEELAKIPSLYDHYIMTEAQNLPKKELSKPWQEFWKSFSKHGEKQKTIETYGKTLQAIDSRSELFNEHTPYANFLSEEVSKKLDRLKQRGLYVDYIESGFIDPSIIADEEIFDELYTFTLERLHSFGSFHCSVERSKAMLLSALEYIKVVTSDDLTEPKLEQAVKKYSSISNRPTSTEISIVELDILYWASHRSSSPVPDYVKFKEVMQHCTKELNKSELFQSLDSVLKKIKFYLELEKYPKLVVRNYQMYKLIYSFSNEAVENGNLRRRHYEKLFT